MSRIEERIEIKHPVDKVFAYTTGEELAEMAVVHTGGGADISGPNDCRHHVQGCEPYDGPEHAVDRHRHGIRVKQKMEQEYYLREHGDRGARGL